ncbi:serine threonine kinase [Podospora aff. communis PSN243]|uniref:Serine threonine kinase n=1 Tax=Podospora aff. communis PSN243 TaxID=3040156 RepID=A0AAV9G1H6_9PEZI|nr:serine threonine kinase [Podospora aff. communis PSN243]
MEVRQREHDLLSFMSLFILTHQRIDVSLSLLGVLIDDASIDIQIKSEKGGYFTVCLAGSEDLLAARSWNSGLEPPGNKILPELVAVKTPRPDEDLNSPRSRRLWSAMAMELQILRNDYLSSHPNIVQLFGVCWKMVNGGVLMPSFVMEGADCDLAKFLNTPSSITYRKVLGLAVDTITGVKALHDVGIIHGDIKPENVLICKHPDLKITAKIADFGSSLLQSDIKDPIQPSEGTGFWQAPEVCRPLDGPQLLLTDVYSLGLVLWRLLGSELMYGVLDAVKDTGLTREAFVEQVKRNEERLIGALAHRSLVQIARQLAGPNEPEEGGEGSGNDGDPYAIEKTIEDMATAVLDALEPSSSRCRVNELLENMRNVMNRFLVWEEFRAIDSNDFNAAMNLNPQEKDIWRQPSIKEPSEDDVERIMQHGVSMAWLNQSFDNIRLGTSLSAMPGIDGVPESVAAAHRDVAWTLERWRRMKAPRPQDVVSLRRGGEVLEAEYSLGTLRSLHPTIINGIMQEVKSVALNPTEEAKRRTEAAWQYALFQLRTVQLDPRSEATITQALQILLQAADGGHVNAGAIVGHLYHCFGRQFPRSPRTELHWLIQGVCGGSGTAKRRLHSLNPRFHAEAMDQLRGKYAGVGIETPSQYYDRGEWHDDDLYWQVVAHIEAGEEKVVSQIVLLSATANRIGLLRKLIDEDLVNVNCVNEWSESPLLCACRSGHRDITLLLLDHGADPCTASGEGLTPLHFLSSFDGEHIPEICARLVNAGASTEARSRTGHKYRRMFDSTFGITDGTTLTWAVVANSAIATQTLIEHGADPFDLDGLELPYSDTFGSMTHVSPVWYASTQHQYYLLEILLRNIEKAKAERFINTYRRGFGSANAGAENDFPIIQWCVAYAGHGIGTRMLLHGKDHEHAFKQTLRILLDHGANTSGLLDIAVSKGQPFVIEHLLGDQAILEVTPDQWLHAILVVGDVQDWVMFDTLLRYSQAESISPEKWMLYYGTLRGLPDKIEYLEPFRQHRDPAEDFFAHFAHAMMRGKFNLAKWFYDTGLCDLSRRVSATETILGALIRRSKSYSNAIIQMEQLLRIKDLPDALFWDVAQFDETSFSALHMAVYFPEYRTDSTMARKVVRMIVRRWYEPEHLNAQVADGEFKGRTAMHIAALTGNLEAVRCLLTEESESLDLDLADANGFSILDTAAWGLVSQKDRILLWDLPSEARRAADMDHWQRVIEIIIRLLQAGARPRKIAVAVTRTEKEKVVVLDLQKVRRVTVPFKFFGDDFPAELQGDQFWSAVSKLEIDQSFFIGIEENLSDEERQNGVMRRVASFY